MTCPAARRPGPPGSASRPTPACASRRTEVWTDRRQTGRNETRCRGVANLARSGKRCRLWQRRRRESRRDRSPETRRRPDAALAPVGIRVDGPSAIGVNSPQPPCRAACARTGVTSAARIARTRNRCARAGRRASAALAPRPTPEEKGRLPTRNPKMHRLAWSKRFVTSITCRLLFALCSFCASGRSWSSKPSGPHRSGSRPPASAGTRAAGRRGKRRR